MFLLLALKNYTFSLQLTIVPCFLVRLLIALNMLSWVWCCLWCECTNYKNGLFNKVQLIAWCPTLAIVRDSPKNFSRHNCNIVLFPEYNRKYYNYSCQITWNLLGRLIHWMKPCIWKWNSHRNTNLFSIVEKLIGI